MCWNGVETEGCRKVAYPYPKPVFFKNHFFTFFFFFFFFSLINPSTISTVSMSWIRYVRWGKHLKCAVVGARTCKGSTGLSNLQRQLLSLTTLNLLQLDIHSMNISRKMFLSRILSGPLYDDLLQALNTTIFAKRRQKKKWSKEIGFLSLEYLRPLDRKHKMFTIPPECRWSGLTFALCEL